MHSANDGSRGWEIALLHWEHTTLVDTPGPPLVERRWLRFYLRLHLWKSETEQEETSVVVMEPVSLFSASHRHHQLIVIINGSGRQNEG